jgi:hypothetical protein
MPVIKLERQRSSPGMGIERRISTRNPPNYTPPDLTELRITRVHFREAYLFCLLSDGNMVCVPLTISSVLAAAPRQVRYQWTIGDDGKEVLWTKGRSGHRAASARGYFDPPGRPNHHTPLVADQETLSNSLASRALKHFEIRYLSPFSPRAITQRRRRDAPHKSSGWPG